MRTSKTKTFHYKIARYNNDPEGYTLQELIENAYDNTTVAQDCAYSFQQDGDNIHFINYFSGNQRKSGEENFLLGAEFLSYVKGNDPIVIELTQQRRELPLQALSVSAEGKEAIEGAIYFGVVEDHIAFTQTNALRSQALETYLNWLIREKGELWTKENFIQLCDPDYPNFTQKERYEPEEIVISSPVVFNSDVMWPEFP